MSDESEAECSVLKARNRTLPGFEEDAAATKWKGDYFFIQGIHNFFCDLFGEILD